MDVDGQSNREPGYPVHPLYPFAADDDLIFFMKYPLPFVKYWYIYVPISHEIPTGGGRPIRLPQNNSQEQVTTPRLGGQTDQVYSGVMIAK
jgi:hypothetical protein